MVCSSPAHMDVSICTNILLGFLHNLCAWPEERKMISRETKVTSAQPLWAGGKKFTSMYASLWGLAYSALGHRAREIHFLFHNRNMSVNLTPVSLFSSIPSLHYNGNSGIAINASPLVLSETLEHFHVCCFSFFNIPCWLPHIYQQKNS